MPTVFELQGYRFFFYSNENNEPIHVHITKGSAASKYWLFPEIKEEYAYGFTLKERKAIKTLLKQNSQLIIDKWNEYFK